MAAFTLDGRRISSREEFWRQYVDVVKPDGAEHFGHNLDAFNDALWGGPGWPGDDLVLTISSSATAIHNLGPEFFKQLAGICRDSHRAQLILL